MAWSYFFTLIIKDWPLVSLRFFQCLRPLFCLPALPQKLLYWCLEVARLKKRPGLVLLSPNLVFEVVLYRLFVLLVDEYLVLELIRLAWLLTLRSLFLVRLICVLKLVLCENLSAESDSSVISALLAGFPL